MSRAVQVVNAAMQIARSAAKIKGHESDWAYKTQAVGAEELKERAHAIELFAAQATERMAAADLLWVSDEMASVVSAAEPTMPPHDFVASSLPWENCFCLVDQGLSFSFDPHHRSVVAIHWSHVGTRVICSMFERSEGNYFFMAATILVEGEPITGDRTGDRAASARWLACLWLMLQQRIAVRESRGVPRSSRHRWERQMASDLRSVTEVVLRRAALGESAGEPRAVDWSHRWIVGGHWRNQWMPSMNSHRPTWIAPYVKGPEELPLVVKERVNVFVR